MLKAQKAPIYLTFNVFVNVLYTPNLPPLPRGLSRETEIHIYIQNPWNTQNQVPRTNSQKLPVIKYCYKDSHSRGYRGHRSISKSNSHKNTHLISNLHVVDSLEVSFTKFARAVFRNQIFDLWLEKLKGFTLLKVNG